MKKPTLSPTLAANEALARRRREGLPVLPLAFGEASLPVHPALLERLKAAASHGEYGPVAGIAELRSAAAGYWARRGLPTAPEQVVCGPGSKPLLYSLLLAIGGDVAIPVPSWVSYAAQAELVGGRPLLIQTLPGHGGVPNPDRLANAVDRARAQGRDVRSVIVTLPDNPTSTVAGPDIVHRLCQVAKSRNLIIISDEIYRDLIHDPTAEYLSPASIAPDRTVVTTGLAKNLALGGWRIGVARLPDSPLGRKLNAGLVSVASEVWSTTAVPIQYAAAFAFSEPPELVTRIAASRALHATVVHAVANRFLAAGATLATPQAAFYLYPDLENWRERLSRTHSVVAGEELSQLLLHRYGMGVLPGSSFGEEAKSWRFRVATSQLYGDTEEKRAATLASADPLSLPWISSSLSRLDEIFNDLLGSGQKATLTSSHHFV